MYFQREDLAAFAIETDRVRSKLDILITRFYILKVNKATMNMLHRVEPYVTYGYPNLKSVSELIYKRGYGKVDERTLFDEFVTP
ncbi:hypothetical protein K1719_017057 [Acacia pycnantha]|nr:hypothetical protein K1719_017057 [Acacia pycnantha]